MIFAGFGIVETKSKEMNKINDFGGFAKREAPVVNLFSDTPVASTTPDPGSSPKRKGLVPRVTVTKKQPPPTKQPSRAATPVQEWPQEQMEYDYGKDDYYNQGQEVVLWQEHFSENGETYYFEPISGNSSWEYPSESNVQILSQYQDDEGNWCV